MDSELWTTIRDKCCFNVMQHASTDRCSLTHLSIFCSEPEGRYRAVVCGGPEPGQLRIEIEIPIRKGLEVDPKSWTVGDAD